MDEASLLGPGWAEIASIGNESTPQTSPLNMNGSSPPLGPPPGRPDSHGSLTTRVSLEAGPTTQTASDASSILRLQKNLQRLSRGQLNLGSRSSLPDILEDCQADDADVVGRASGTAVRWGGNGNIARNISDEDLFLIDMAANAGLVPGGEGTQSTAPASGSDGDRALAGQLPVSASESRALFIRGLDPAIPDDAIQEYFECFGDIHSLYTASKHRGYVMVTYHDIRAARLAQHTAHGQMWRGRQLFCHFSRDSDALPGAAGTRATVLLVSLDGGRSLDDAFYYLSAYGELRDLRRDTSRPNCCLAEFYDDRHASAAIAGISTAPELRTKFLALDASVPANNTTLNSQHGHGMPQSASTHGLSTGATHGSSSTLDSMGVLLTTAPSGGPSMQQPNAVDLANMTRNLSEMSLESSQAPLALNMSTGDLMGQLSSGGPSRAASVYPMHGIASSGSLGVWPPQGTAGQMSLGSSPVGTGMWPNHSALAVQDMLLAQQQMTAAALIQQQQQQQQQQQSQVVHAALQQAMLTQQVAAAAMGMHAGGLHPGLSALTGSLGMPRRGFSEPVLGGRLARRPMDPSAEAERRAQQERLYGLDLTRIAGGEDKRTTLMIKNIPNKYTQKMLLALMEERFAGVTPFPFDFFYLPIDFKNRCNVGYAFINMTSPAAIPTLVEEFHGRRWPKFNSEKVCAIAYARIQGKNALVQHFQNSSLLHEDKRCRPVLFGPNGEVEVFPIITPVGPGGLGGLQMGMPPPA